MNEEISLSEKKTYAKYYFSYLECRFHQGDQEYYATQRPIRDYYAYRSRLGKEKANIIETEISDFFESYKFNNNYDPDTVHKVAYKQYLKFLKDGVQEEKENNKPKSK